MKNLLSILFVCLLALSSFGQELWLGAGVKADLGERFSGSVENQVRFTDYVEEWRLDLTQFGAEYKVLPWVEIAGKYRHTVVHRKDNEHRVMGDVKLETDLGDSDWEVGYRFRCQTEWEVDREDYSSLVRNKISVSNKFNKLLKTSYSAELFHGLSPEFSTNRYRLTAAVETRLLKLFDLETFIRYQSEVEEAEVNFGNEPDKGTIIGLTLTYKFDLLQNN